MTFQIRERMIYRKENRAILALPLQNCGRPVPASDGLSSACWRNYVGTWEVREDVLHIVELHEPHRGRKPNRLSQMFPEYPGPVEADWFSGEIVAGDLRLGFGSDPPQEPFLWFALVIYKGKLLLEETANVQDNVVRHRLTNHVEDLFPKEEVGFLHAIHDNLDDPAQKLIYADWLDEKGDPRAETLRNEVERRAKESPPQRWTDILYSEGIPTGYVSPEDRHWFWCWLSGIRDLTPWEKQRRQFLEKIRQDHST